MIYTAGKIGLSFHANNPPEEGCRMDYPKCVDNTKDTKRFKSLKEKN